MTGTKMLHHRDRASHVRGADRRECAQMFLEVWPGGPRIRPPAGSRLPKKPRMPIKARQAREPKAAAAADVSAPRHQAMRKIPQLHWSSDIDR